MCGVVKYIYRCNHFHVSNEPCRNVASGYACSGRHPEKDLALSDTCPTCGPAYQKWLQLQAAGNEKLKKQRELEESRKLSEWYRQTLFETS
ncbi:hypothetical protein FRC03_010030 [Tulasnella sp. 419]|nr:hypothetical protein FRC02_005551 [Tulasnella sp. 418]KAG8967414.1 hypothetical protein FRC03_010030 [Tulasnella sp. 419]